MTTMQSTIEEFLADLRRQDVQLWLEGDNLRCNAPEEVLTDALSAELKSRKPEIIAFLQKSVSTGGDRTIPIVSRTEPIPLSFAQQRLWFLEQMQQGVYNIPFAIRVEGQLDLDLFERCLNEIVQRHEVLRTNFQVEDGEPHQVFEASRPIQITQVSLESESNPDQAIEEHSLNAAQQSFDLTKDSLIQVTLLKIKPEQFVVLLTFHHIVADGWSIEVFLKELTQLYRAFLTGQPSPLPALPVQYADFAAWQRQYLQGENLDRHLNYWRSQLGGELPVLQLPTDFPRARVQSFRGAVVNFELSQATTDKLNELARGESTTLYVVLLSAFKVLLFRYTGQNDVIVGTPVANRTLPEIEGLIGFFINTLVLRSV
ncbi:MAG: condensation domain-containing protein, partial [Cyanobacteria bacterium P01_F01_bin.42]